MPPWVRKFGRRLSHRTKLPTAEPVQRDRALLPAYARCGGLEGCAQRREPRTCTPRNELPTWASRLNCELAVGTPHLADQVNGGMRVLHLDTVSELDLVHVMPTGRHTDASAITFIERHTADRPRIGLGDPHLTDAPSAASGDQQDQT